MWLMAIQRRQPPPNQLFAVSLPFTLLEGKQAHSVLKIVEQRTVYARGLALSRPMTTGMWASMERSIERDSSYHQGTAWSWLLGAYVDSIIKVKAESQKQKCDSELQVSPGRGMHRQRG